MCNIYLEIKFSSASTQHNKYNLDILDVYISQVKFIDATLSKCIIISGDRRKSDSFIQYKVLNTYILSDSLQATYYL